MATCSCNHLHCKLLYLSLLNERNFPDRKSEVNPNHELRGIFAILFRETVKRIVKETDGSEVYMQKIVHETTKKAIRENIRGLVAPLFVQNDTLPRPTWISTERTFIEIEPEYLDSGYWNYRRRQFGEKYLQQISNMKFSDAF